MKLQPGDYVSTEGMTEEEYHAVCRAFIEAGAKKGEYGVYNKDSCNCVGWGISGVFHGRDLWRAIWRDQAEWFGLKSRELTIKQVMGKEEQKMTKVTVFGQEEANKEEKRAIELCLYVNSTHEDVNSYVMAELKEVKEVVYLRKARNGMDWIMVIHYGEETGDIYLGHWNDGVV